MEYYEELTYALKQLSVVQSFYHAGRLEAYKENCGSRIDCDEDFLYANWWELVEAAADFVDVRWDESETCERLYFSDAVIRRCLAQVQKHADNLGIRLKNDPYYQEICNDVYDILLDACPYNCCFRVVAQTHHKRGFGLSVWIYCEQFYDLGGLLNGKTGNIFDPQGTTTRAQVAVIMQKLCEKTGK